MTHRSLLIILIPILLSSCDFRSSPTVTVDWMGTYKASSIERVDSPNSITGKLTLSSPKQLEKQGNKIEASLGTRFGVAFKFDARNSKEIVDYEEIWHFPQPGLTNPNTGRTMVSEKYNVSCRVNTSCIAGRVSSETWELRPGSWAVEILVNNKLIVRQVFEIAIK